MQVDGIAQRWDNIRKTQELQSELNKAYSGTTASASGNNINVTNYKGYSATIDTINGTITLSGGSGEVAITSIIINEFKIEGIPVSEASIPVPSGFTHTEGTKDTGYVITNNTTGDQFVWVPVDKNQKIYIKVTSEEPITSIVLTNPVGEEKSVGNVSGTEYEVDPASFTKAYNGMYSLVATAESGATAVDTLTVRSLYAMDVYNDYYKDYYSTDESINQMISTAPPQFNINNKDDLFQYFGNMLGKTLTTNEEFGSAFANYNANEMSSRFSDTEDYTTKVNTNGGFYIGRYEATKNGDNVASKQATVDNNNAPSVSDGMVWIFISQTDSLAKANAYNASLTSSLLTGAAWDRTLGWIIESNKNIDLTKVFNSSGWGNYRDDTFSGTTGPIRTGTFEQTKANNIYDLAGNLSEWTTEAYNTSGRVDRGGYYYSEGSGNPASYRNFDNNPSNTNLNFVGFRIALYL